FFGLQSRICYRFATIFSWRRLPRPQMPRQCAQRHPPASRGSRGCIIEPDTDLKQFLSLFQPPSAEVRYNHRRERDFAAAAALRRFESCTLTRLLEALDNSELRPIQINVAPA